VATTDGAVGAHGTDLAQALTLAGLLAGASLSLSRLYQGAGWVPAVWLSMGCALGLAALLRRLGVGQLLSLLAMAAGFIVVAGVLLFPETLLVVLPTGDTLAAMAQAVGDALQGISQQAAPVAVTREFLLLTCAGAWAVATAADGLAFGARQPLLALLPAGGLLVFPALIRDSGPAWYAAWFLAGGAGLLLFEARARLATWGRWVSSPRARPASGWRLPLTRASAIGRWMLAVAALLALSLAWLLPGYGQRPLLDYRGGPNANAAIAINPFVSLRSQLISQDDRPLFEVTSSQPSYWRLIVDDRFDGTTFTPSSPRQLTPVTSETGPDLAAGAPTTKLSQRFTIERLGGPYLPAATLPVSARSGDHQILQSPVNRNLSIQQRLRPGLAYTVTSAMPSPTAAQLATVRVRDYDGIPWLRPYLDAANVDPRVASLARSVAGDKPDPFRRALALQDYLRSPAFAHSLDVPDLARGGDQLRRFLLEVRTGYCQQFAAAMAAMARVVGIPSRVAVGFTPGVQAGDRFQVTSKDAHAWPELYFPGVGWVRFEPTPRGDGQVDLPGYTTPAGRRTTPPTTAAGSGTAGPAQTASSGGNAKLEAENSDAGSTLGTPASGRQKAARRGIVALVVLLALVALVPATKLGRNTIARRRASRWPREVVAEAYQELTGWAGDAAIGRRAAETPHAYARRLAEAFADAARPLAELTELYVAAEYAPGDPDGQQAQQARRLARTARGGWPRGWAGTAASARSSAPRASCRGGSASGRADSSRWPRSLLAARVPRGPWPQGLRPRARARAGRPRRSWTWWAGS
jgi:transglutaminase-like putative cysteine protease